ncbi:MAG: hypothetical protein ACRESZ_09920, partial [Methylococcales bacterium]
RPESVAPTEIPKGITIVPLSEQSVPKELKDQAKMEISKMQQRGFVDAPESSVGTLDALDRARIHKKDMLKPIDEITNKLAILPSSLGVSQLSKARLLGAQEAGGLREGGWTGLFRLFSVPKLGLVGLEENDYIASRGGFAMIKEAINQEVNGRPAILSVQQSQSGKALSELTWATDRKIYTLTFNRAIKTQKAINYVLGLANEISD